MTYRSTQAARRTLFELAAQQGGYFTAKQAARAGYSKQHVDYHAKVGNFERVERGMFRLPEVPISKHDDLIRLALWSRGRNDRPQAVASHETALGVLGLGELLPKKVHLTIPPTFRKKPPRTVVLHRMRLADDDVEERDGFYVTGAMRTLLDVSAAGAISQDQFERAVADAFRLGFVRRTALTKMLGDHNSVARPVASGNRPVGRPHPRPTHG